jgi:glyoxylase-like metal-dependent hydrolase (beta-lactamase superfamily II)
MGLFTTWIAVNRVPEINELEITIFGPGIGEALAVHLGNNEWLLVDSCRVGNAKRPATLEYLESIGVNPAQAVRLIVATHWHNDHIGGLSQIVKSCPNARFVCPAVLASKEFRSLIELQNADNSFRSDTTEFEAILLC